MWPGPAENSESSTRGEKLWSQSRSTGRTGTCWKEARHFQQMPTTTEATVHCHDKEGNCTAGLQHEEHRQQGKGRHFLLLCSTGEAAAGELNPSWTPAPRIGRFWRVSSTRLLTWPGGCSMWPSSPKSKVN